MNKLFKYMAIMVMIAFVFIQIYCINYCEKDKNNIIVYNSQNRVHNNKTLKEFSEELNYLSNKSILSANKIDGKWYVKVKIIGNKEELLTELGKLKNYDISDYNINKTPEESSVIVQISAKDGI
ncbi:hypothetical protein [Clostridium sp.]|jgi:hypothetical protein|uniref:hypothetical protein n=1 Tax=Clostridium sp. TaxID=1506 RepID=UPI00284563C4|nr:hypothetical protein [Clostridium sp.]MDR3596788.1 hypothetical protein [Clostridium sp.]